MPNATERLEEIPGPPLMVLWGLGNDWGVVAERDNQKEAFDRFVELELRLKTMERGWVYLFDHRGIPVRRWAMQDWRGNDHPDDLERTTNA